MCHKNSQTYENQDYTTRNLELVFKNMAYPVADIDPGKAYEKGYSPYYYDRKRNIHVEKRKTQAHSKGIYACGYRKGKQCKIDRKSVV